MADTTTEDFHPANSNQNMGLRPKPNMVELRKARKAKKAQLKAEAELREFQNDHEAFQNFIDRAELWYRNHEKKYMQSMALVSSDKVTFIEFQMVMRTIQAPFTYIELAAMFRLMDPDATGQAEYGKLSECLWNVLTERIITDLTLDFHDPLNHRNWILLTFKVPTLEAFNTSLTFEELVTLDYTGSMLRQIILLRRTNLPSRSLVLFTDPSQFLLTLVQSRQRLRDLHYKGGPKTAPKEGVIYYEFSAGHIDCPLLTHNSSLDRYQTTDGDKMETWSTFII